MEVCEDDLPSRSSLTSSSVRVSTVSVLSPDLTVNIIQSKQIRLYNTVYVELLDNTVKRSKIQKLSFTYKLEEQKLFVINNSLPYTMVKQELYYRLYFCSSFFFVYLKYTKRK